MENPQEREKYGPILFDFRYLRQSDDCEARIEASADLIDLDDEFRENHIQILERFYMLFESIFKYISDFLRYLEELEEGVFIQHTFEGVLLNQDGKQLMAEAVYLFGVMLIILDTRIEGVVRERMLISYYRYKGQSDIPNIDEVCKLCRSTGYQPNNPKAKRPAKYPEDYFARFRIDEDVIAMIIGRLRSDDIYSQITAYPIPDHRSTALSTQAGMLYVILYFAPHLLHKEQAVMREIVDKHFNDNWVISYYMGFTVDLSQTWAGYGAAKAALSNTLSASNVKAVQAKHVRKLPELIQKVNHFLDEGILTEESIVDQVNRLLQCLRACNVTIRWLMMHRTTRNAKLRELATAGVDPDQVLLLLLNTAQFEYILKEMYTKLLDSKEDRWNEFKKQGQERMQELSEYFSGEKALTRVAKDEQLQAWFANLSEQISTLDYHDSTLAGRKMQQLSSALEEVEQFHQIETNIHVKHFLAETRQYLQQMVRTVNCKEEILIIITLVSDISYAREIMDEYVPMMQTRIKRDPRTVLKLRATFLKLASVLDMPCVRINQASSPDLVSVSEYYSSQLVSFVRKVLQVIPVSMFSILDEIIDVQIDRLKELPTRILRTELKEWAQLEERHALARATHQISVFTEGILAMETTFVGVIRVDPKQLLEDGIRKELVHKISEAMDSLLVFDGNRVSDFEARLDRLTKRLEGFRRSFEYIQDYVNIYGLKIWQEEFSRICDYYVESECNTFLKKKIYDWASKYQNEAIPIPRFRPRDDKSVNFMGRLTRELLLQTDPRRTVFVDQMSAWVDVQGREVVGIRTFSILHRSVGIFGLTGMDKLLCFMIVRDLQRFVKAYRTEVNKPLKDYLRELSSELNPTNTIPFNVNKHYSTAQQRCARLWPILLEATMSVGHAQLARRQIAHELNFSCKLESNQMYCALDVMNKALISDVRAHYTNPDTMPYPADDNELLPTLSNYLEASGINHPSTKIYITTEPLDNIPLIMFLFVTAQFPRFKYETNVGGLVCRAKGDPLDGAPFALGIISILKQFHSEYTDKFLGYLGQSVRSIVNTSFSKDQKPSKLPLEVVNCLHFLEDFCKYSHLPRKQVYAHVPSFLFDCFKN